MRTEEYVPYPDASLAGSAPRPVLVLAGTLDPLVEVGVYREHGVEPVLLDGVNHFFSRRLGNQAPADADLTALCRHTLAFLLDEV